MSKKLDRRRQFLKRSAHMALLGATGSAVGGKMSLIGSALAAQGDYANLPGYKALVCVFLYGGSDSFNMFVPGDQGLLSEYSNSRGDLALGSSQLTADATGSVYFNNNLGALRESYNAGNLAIVRNVGNLIRPTSAAEFASNPKVAPADLFAHNSQQEQVLKGWSSKPVALVGAGWGGRMADLLMEANSGNGLPATFSMNNANFFQPGNRSTPISINARKGPSLLPILDRVRSSSNSDRDAVLEQLLALPSDNVLEKFASNSFRNARDSSRLLSSTIQNSPDFGPFDITNSAETQLRMVARMIAGREQLGMKRQIFFVGAGGWDTHDNQTGRLNGLTSGLNSALAKFQTALATIGVENDVTTFTASDFGRTLTINGDGSDHGWGGHYMVMGGAVNGGQLYGNWPDYALGGRDDIGKGRLVPEMSVNQYGAAMGSWMGLSNSDLLDVFPDLSGFDTGWQSQYGLFG
ncbi:MAG: DUF1501 domain-containing protein [Granulosicoccus sp.]